ncbi:MAG: carbohydrate kinase family protein [Chloroflexi bacterium]|nr:carbohydrate kinase family protein [Chloroflexota bacterium]
MSDRPVAVTVIGDALLDVTATLREPMRHGEDVPAAIAPRPGGQGANVAVRLARRGVGVRLVCGLGDDVAGRLIREALAAEGVELAPLPVDATGSVLIIVDDTGERTMLSHRAPFTDQLTSEVLPDAPWTIVSGYALAEPGADAAATSLASHPGRRAVLGCAVSSTLRATWRAAAKALRADLVIANADEARNLAPLEELAANVVVTSADGAAATLAGIPMSVAGERDSNVADATGAGDAFAAALLAGLVRGTWPPPRADFETALAAAVGVAGEVARVAGAQGRVPSETVGSTP